MKRRLIINHIVNWLLLLEISSILVFCKEVKIVRVSLTGTNWYLDSNWAGQTYFEASNTGGYQKWIMEENGKSQFQLKNLVTQQVFAALEGQNAITEQNREQLNSYWTMNGNKIRNVQFNIVIGTSFSSDCTIEVLFKNAKVSKIRSDTNVYLGSNNQYYVFLTKEQKTDQIIWISTNNPNITGTFYLINAASNYYLQTTEDRSEPGVTYIRIRTDVFDNNYQKDCSWLWSNNVYLKSQNNVYAIAHKSSSAVSLAENPVNYNDNYFYKTWTEDDLF